MLHDRHESRNSGSYLYYLYYEVLLLCCCRRESVVSCTVFHVIQRHVGQAFSLVVSIYLRHPFSEQSIIIIACGTELPLIYN